MRPIRLGTPPVDMVELLGGLRPDTRLPVPCMLMGRGARPGVVAVDVDVDVDVDKVLAVPLLALLTTMLFRCMPVLLGGRLMPDTDVLDGAGVLGFRGDMACWP